MKIRSNLKSFFSWRKLTVFIFVFSFLFLGSLFFLFSKNSESAALLADNVLRPLIGDKAVISLEGFVFNIQDGIFHLYKTKPSLANYHTLVKTVSASSVTVKPPPNIIPYVDKSNPLDGEGVWKKIEGTNLYTTFIRTDNTRPYSVVNLVFIPMKVYMLGAVAGTKYPGGPTFTPGTGKVPLDIQESGRLIAAFNGGFKEKDGHYGMYSDNITYVPLRKGLATLYIYNNGHLEISAYDGNPIPQDVVTARQNGPFLVLDGKTTAITSMGIDYWAGTATGGYITWRSGVGITPNGDLIYAVGPSLTPTALADALRLAGSVNAMELDINAFWVRFNIFAWDSVKRTYTYFPLVKGLADGGKEFLNGYQKDFFYLYKE